LSEHTNMILQNGHDANTDIGNPTILRP